MNGYHVDWVGAISAGIIAGVVFFLLKTAFPRLKGVSFYLALGLLIAGSSLVVRELLRRAGI
ncbi:MAG TPA: hypothetical protein VNZ02_02700 [Steroidobacteraceae bacterium]|jgi:hypothetical protein|nr:hypothetical protein [Steroidobacteraceae bacterium]